MTDRLARVLNDDDSARFALLAAAAYVEDPTDDFAAAGLDVVLDARPGGDLPTRVVVGTGDRYTVIALRGTARFEFLGGPEVWLDWLGGWIHNGAAAFGSSPASELATSYQGELHPGFALIAKAVLGPIREALSTLPRSRPIVVCGHSQGGAVSTLLFAPLVQDGYQIRRIYSYGAPRAGDDVFADSYDGPLVRHENADDLVCLLPPGWVSRMAIDAALSGIGFSYQLPPVDFKHTGRLRFYHWAGPDQDASGAMVTLARTGRLVSQLTGMDGIRRTLGDHRVPLYIAGVLSRRRRFVDVGGQRAADPRLDAVAAELDPYQRDPQTIMNAIERVAREGLASAAIHDALERMALLDTTTLSGQALADYSYLRQAALWTTGILISNEADAVPLLGLRGMRTLSRILWREDHVSDDIYSAAVQALGVVEANSDPVRRFLLEGAAASTHQVAKEIASDVLGGASPLDDQGLDS